MSFKVTGSSQWRTRGRGDGAFTLVEVMVGVGVLGILAVSLYAGLAQGFAMVQIDRENLRATQILEEKMEVIRLINWAQVNQRGFIPATFTESYDAGGATNTGFNYTGTVIVTNAPITEAYSNDLRMIQATVTWQSGGLTHQRQMTTFVSQYGLQNYVY